MASPESRRIRATFERDADDAETPVVVQRQQWEAAVEAANQALDVQVRPVDLGGVPGEWVRDEAIAEGAALLMLHGGGFNAGSCRTHRAMAARLTRAAGVAVLLIDYRLAPEHPFPAAVEDVAQAYRWLLGQGFPARRIVLGGDSSGGGLALSTLLKLRDDGLEQPAGAFLISPWLDLTLSGPSIHSRAQLDPLVSVAGLRRAAGYYLRDGDPRDALASPLFAPLEGLPPLLIQAGDHELLLSDATRLAERAAEAGVEAQLEVWDEMWHVWHAWADDLPEARAAIERIGAFVRGRLE